MSKKLPPETTGNTTTRTFRLPTEWDQILEYEAKYHNISVSSLLNQIVRRFVNLQRYREQSPAISLNTKTFIEILENMDIDEIIIAATTSGRKNSVDSILQRGAQLNFTSIKWFIEEIYSRYDKWFNVRYYTKKDITEFYFNHDYSKRWSIYLKYYFESVFKTILDLPLEINVMENSVTFTIPNRIRDDV